MQTLRIVFEYFGKIIAACRLHELVSIHLFFVIIIMTCDIVTSRFAAQTAGGRGHAAGHPGLVNGRGGVAEQVRSHYICTHGQQLTSDVFRWRPG